MTIINLETDRISDNISTLFQINKLSVEELKLELNRESVHDLLRMTADVFEVNFKEKDVQLNWELQAKDDKVEVDKNHMLNVFTNIMDNSLKYASDKPVFTISSECSNQELLLVFEDNGIGMSNDQMIKAFDKYYRSDNIEVQATKGMGWVCFTAKLLSICTKEEYELRVNKEWERSYLLRYQ